MNRTVRHFSQYAVRDTELRAIADAPVDVTAIVEVEKKVIETYADAGVWPHRSVTLFILDDLQPLVRQLQETADSPAVPARELAHRPMVNVFDLADPAGCYVFVNRPAMVEHGYWDDPVALEGMLAHEHAHPLAENRTTRAARSLRLELALDGSAESGRHAPDAETQRGQKDRPGPADRRSNVCRQLTLLAENLCLHAPQEIFANETVIRCGFGDALLHLDRRTVTDARRSVLRRDALVRRLSKAVAAGRLAAEEQGPLLLLGDFQAYLDLALEVAPFLRAGRDRDAAELEAVLEVKIFPRLEPEAAQAYRALRDRYRELPPDLEATGLVAWGHDVLNLFAAPLVGRGLPVHFALQTTTPSEGVAGGGRSGTAPFRRARWHP